ncbi:hypothetical protein EDD86DRAFT_200017 [Gorgonomyces haynaldii]|nr:hypothetical protein EDD86DRAFT_200017 [Gorgonomyces haynaldii]
MLTVSDFIQLIFYYYTNKKSVDEALEEMDGLEISRLRDLEINVIACLKADTITLHPDATLLQASQLLIEHKLHRIPLIEKQPDKDVVVSVLTQNKIIRFVAANDKHPDSKKTLRELKIGTFENLISVLPDTSLIKILEIFVKRKISSVPIVDQSGTILNVYEKYDVLLLAKEGPYYDLDIPVSEAMLKRPAVIVLIVGFHWCPHLFTRRHIRAALGHDPASTYS